MAVYSTMIRDDPDSRARMRVTPEQVLNLPVHYCLASWIAGGTRAASFIGQTFPFPTADLRRVGTTPPRARSRDASARTPRRWPRPSSASPRRAAADRRRRRAGREPRRRRAATSDRRSRRRRDRRDRPAPTADRRTRRRHRRPARRRTRPTPTPSARDARAAACELDASSVHAPGTPTLAPSPVPPRRRPPGRRRRPDDADAARRPTSLRELAFIDRINEVREPQHQPPAERQLPRLYDEDYAILALLDRAGLVLPSLIGRAVLPGKEPKTVRHRLNKLYEHGLVARAAHRPPRTHQRRRPPAVAVHAHPPRPRDRPAAHAARDPPAARVARARAAPRRHAPAQPARALLGDRAAPRRRRRSPPTTGAPRATPPAATPSRRSATATSATRSPMRELDVPDGHAILDLPPFREIKPDISLELRDPEPQAHLRPARRARPHRPRPPTTTRSSSPTTPSSPAGRSPTPATGRSAPARSSSSSAATRAPRSPAPQEADRAS